MTHIPANLPIPGREPSNKIPVSQDPPDYLLNLPPEDYGIGVSFNPEDQILPLIYVLQGLSPQVSKANPEYIPGAEPGDFYLRGNLQPIRPGKDGILVIPCAMRPSWVEWLPDRGGFVARHDKEIGATTQNIIQENRELYLLVASKPNGILLWQPYILPCASTKITFAKEWNRWWQQILHPQTGGVMPTTSQAFRLTTKLVKKNQHEWFGLKFQALGFVNADIYRRAKEFALIAQAGHARPETPIGDVEL
jgi:hypothetical protein